MDSGNSGSMNSSSGGDDHDFDSRATAESISALFNPPHTQIPNPNPSFSFDPQSNFFNNPFVNHNSSSGWSDPSHSGFDPSQSLPVSLPVPAQTVVQTTTQAVRNPKKRSRASRRAPTTVLTTDTSNFRAMVQEFTGIPASPFMTSSASSGPFIRSKLDDFFRVPSSIRSNLSPHQPQPQLPNYLLKPFPQKLQQPPPFLSSSSFQSLLQSDPNYNPSSSGLVGSKPSETEPDEAILKTGLLNEFGFSQPEIAGVCSGGNNNYGSSLQGFSDGRLSFLGSSSSSNYQTAKVPENVGARGEGMVESWICSSDQ